MEQPPSGDGPTDQILRTEVACCIAGCGPAGAMLGLLLARAGVEVLVLEKHADFLRDFRGDTLHPSTLRLFDELGLAEQLLDLPHQKSAVLRVTTDYGDYTLADFRRLPGPYRFIAFMPSGISSTSSSTRPGGCPRSSCAYGPRRSRRSMRPGGWWA
jgi:FAD binding domain